MIHSTFNASFFDRFFNCFVIALPIQQYEKKNCRTQMTGTVFYVQVVDTSHISQMALKEKKFFKKSYENKTSQLATRD